ncbi:hypothetical protein E1176_06555 [Fulvivirga sp. RKSG066]|uniref:hypothetical protein n=1 Tax=Fulvivirga aurantia TaxID=2529383 RepID=UPI0012BD1BB0|nr:hypothetical protein [Fulvivirga aurantia]MTI20676.1 hypothetical protein [Fulvivirga aurantia]
MFFKSIVGVLLIIGVAHPSWGQDDDDKPKVTVGGALRFNYNYSTWKEGQKKRGGDFGYDIFRINAQGEHKGIKFNAEYRLYSEAFGGGMLKQGWIAYAPNDKKEIQLGLTQVPFGITRYNSNNWFFGINYYIGFEDDHDMGIKLQHKGERWEYDLAYFKNAEELIFGNNSDVSNSRYSYDIASIDLDGDGDLEVRNKEVNQVNAKLVYKIGPTEFQHHLGASLQYGGVYNLDTEDLGSHHALALHYELKANRFTLKSQVTNYKKETANPDPQPENLFAMTAYGAPYQVAAEAITYTVGLSYSLPVDWKPISNLEFYNDFGVMDKTEESFENSYMNVAGVLITAGSIYTYVDFASGKNHPWLGPVWEEAFSTGTAGANWEMRFNINLGYYF